MKNLLIYTGPNKKFSKEDQVLVKIQIDNSLDLGWKKEDIILATDFPFTYRGVTSLVLPDGLYYDFDKNANKVPVIIHLITNKLITENQLYWSHDLDAYENSKITEQELGLENYDLGLTHYGYKPQWQFGSLFFKSTSKDIFKLLSTSILERPHFSRNNEKELTRLIKRGKIDQSRYKKLNPTYNFMKKYIQTMYREAEKPLKVLHFRPSDALSIFMHGKNRLKIPLMSERLIKIFNKHGIE